MYVDRMEEFDNVCFTCYCCRQTFKGLNVFQKHLEICARAFQNEGKKFQHYNVHNIGDNSSKRTYIGDPKNLEEQSKGSQIKFQCEFCEEILDSLQEWMQHRSETHSMDYEPPGSRETVMNDSNNDVDLVMTRLNIKAQKSYSHLIKCPADQCGFYPATMIYTHIHKDHPNSTLRYNCSICGDIFATEYDVVSHRMDEHKDQIDNENLDNDEAKVDNTQVIHYQTLQDQNDVTIQETVIVTEDVAQQQSPDQLITTEQQQSPKQSSVFLSLKTDNNDHVGSSSIVNTSGIIWPKKRGRRPKAGNVSPRNITLHTTQTNLKKCENEENSEPEYIKFTEGNQYIDEKNDIQLSLTITRAPTYNQHVVGGRSGVMRSPRLFKAKSRLGHDVSPMLSVVQPRQDNIVSSQILQQYQLHEVQSTNESSDLQSTTNEGSAGSQIIQQYHIQDVQSTANVVTDGEARMIVVAAGSAHQMVVGEDGGTVQTLGATVETLEGTVETLGGTVEGHQQTYFIQHQDGTQIQEIQAKVISEAEALDEGVETVEMTDQTILHVPGADGEQPTFVIQSQQFESQQFEVR